MHIQVDQLTKQFGNFTSVDNLSFSVNAGEVYGFLGQNGAGKSTTIRMILSLIKPTHGTIKLFGKSLQDDREYILSKTGAMVEKPDLYKYLNAIDNMKIFSKYGGLSLSRDEIMNQLAVVGLESRAHDKVKKYSQGMKQRLGIAIAMVNNPDLIILDEPTNGLDPQGITDIRNLILMLSRDKKKTVVVSSHLLSEVEQIADSMLIINKGKKIVEGRVNELLSPGKVQLEIETLNNEEAKLILRSSAWSDSLKGNSKEKLIIEVNRANIQDLTKYLVDHGVGLIGIKSVNSLEAYFLSLTSEHAV
ncbi:MAG: bacitracin ABC transporter ATP-binding protein [Chitinophagaceae bacterium]|nr:MAG: bacitracin ABC transporter ATP-binding protein [Chitinophagaceae bacterium]